MIVFEKVIVIGKRCAFGTDVDKCPAGIGKVNRTGGKFGDGIGDSHFLVEVFGVFHPDDMRNVEQEVATNREGFVFSVVRVEVLDRCQKINRKR